MPDTLMILPASDVHAIRLIRIPEDYEAHEAFRHITGLIAAVEEADPDYDWEDVAAACNLTQDLPHAPIISGGLRVAVVIRRIRDIKGLYL